MMTTVNGVHCELMLRHVKIYPPVQFSCAASPAVMLSIRLSQQTGVDLKSFLVSNPANLIMITTLSELGFVLNKKA